MLVPNNEFTVGRRRVINDGPRVILSDTGVLSVVGGSIEKTCVGDARTVDASLAWHIWTSVEEIEQCLGVSKDTIYAWIANKGMAAHRVERLWKLITDEVDNWVRAGGAADESKPSK